MNNKLESMTRQEFEEYLATHHTYIPGNPKYVKKQEVDPNGKNPHEPGAKLDDGKAPVYRGVIAYFPRAIKEVAKVSAFGASKYTWNGWETVPDGISRYSDANGRHIADEAIEGPYTLDSKLLHKAHAAWNALAALELTLREMEKNNATV